MSRSSDSWCELRVKVFSELRRHLHIGRNLIHDPKFESSRNRAKRGLDMLEESDVDEFAADVPRDPKNVTLISRTGMSRQCSQTLFGTRVLDFHSSHRKPLILNFVINADNVAKLCREEMLKQTSVSTIP